MDTVVIRVEGLEANAITRTLKGIRGVRGVDIDLAENTAIVTYDDRLPDVGVLHAAIGRIQPRDH